MKTLQNKLKGLTGPENKKKRRYIYEKLSKLKKALGNPDTYIIDPVKKQ